MTKTILITGCSAGIGKASARYFARKGWNVIATMRTPKKAKDLEEEDKIDIRQMDVTDKQSIHETINQAVDQYQKIDVLVNNAGYGVFGAFEAATDEKIKKQYDTNVFGVMNTIKAILPHFRAKKDGMVINISSGVGKVPLPMQSLYASTKFALEGFSEALSYEMKHLGITAKLVLPGNIQTEFFQALSRTDVSDYPDYAEYQDKILYKHDQLNAESKATPEDVAKVIYKAATDRKSKLRYLVGKDIKSFAPIRKLLPDRLFMKMVRNRFEK